LGLAADDFCAYATSLLGVNVLEALQYEWL
jgi:hypothetical protein